MLGDLRPLIQFFFPIGTVLNHFVAPVVSPPSSQLFYMPGPGQKINKVVFQPPASHGLHVSWRGHRWSTQTKMIPRASSPLFVCACDDTEKGWRGPAVGLLQSGSRTHRHTYTQWILFLMIRCQHPSP
jgi:hypothetical protein